MKTTYDGILKNMKNAFFERCGESANDFGDTAARLEAAASELFSLACENEFILAQAFPQTAAGEYLDFHAALRDIHRKEAAKSTGTLTFILSEPAQSEITVPEGTVCSKEGEPYIQFATTDDAVIHTGETQVSVSAESLESGADYNAPAGTVTVMVNPPAGVDSVTNNASFSGGCIAETDEMLRKRILDSYSIMQGAFTLDSIREGIMKTEGVLDCRPTYDNGVLRIALRVATGADFNLISQSITDKMVLTELIGCSLEIVRAESDDYSLTIEIKSGKSDVQTVIDEVREAAQKYARARRIDEDVTLSGFVYTASAVKGVDFCEVSSPQAVSGIIICPQNTFLSLNEIKVNCYD